MSLIEVTQGSQGSQADWSPASPRQPRLFQPYAALYSLTTSSLIVGSLFYHWVSSTRRDS